jgi:molecular chaperone GrpE
VSDENLRETETQASQDGQGPVVSDAPEDVAVTNEEAQALGAEQAAEYLAALQRERAEFSNYRKRMEKDRSQWQDAIRSDFILELLPVLDDFDRATENLPEEGPARDWASGVLLIQRKLKSQLENLGLEEINAAGTFDPQLHEAVTHETSDKHEPGEVIAVLRKGYRLGERILRPALVRVAS